MCFQGFHKDRYAVDVITPTSLHFTVPGSERDRQVSAYQKGHRPTCALNQLHPTFDGLVVLKILQDLCDEIGEAFVDAQRQVKASNRRLKQLARTKWSQKGTPILKLGALLRFCRTTGVLGLIGQSHSQPEGA